MPEDRPRDAARLGVEGHQGAITIMHGRIIAGSASSGQQSKRDRTMKATWLRRMSGAARLKPPGGRP